MTAPDVAWLTAWPSAPDAFRLGCVFVGRMDSIPPPAEPLDPTAQDRAEAMLRPTSARPGFLARRLVLRRFVAIATGEPAADVLVAAHATGQPRLVRPAGPWHVSTSARHGWLALALARHPVGVDIEAVADAGEPAWNVLATDERARLAALPSHLQGPAFLGLWTAKEAYLKATGAGLRREPSEVDARLERDTLTIADRGTPIPGLGLTRLLGGAPPRLRAAMVIMNGLASSQTRTSQGAF